MHKTKFLQFQSNSQFICNFFIMTTEDKFHTEIARDNFSRCLLDIRHEILSFFLAELFHLDI